MLTDCDLRDAVSLAAYAVAFTNAGIAIAGLLSILAFQGREHPGQRIVAIAVITVGLDTGLVCLKPTSTGIPNS
jgi:hypothetical protein